jgi:glycosyltransferase 2 family protein
MTDSRPSAIHIPLAARWLLTLVFFGLLGWFLDLEQLLAELSRFSVLAVGLALLVSVAQVVLSAWRWRYTARRLGLKLAMKASVTEYYLAMFLNQCLPGGVVGDVNRAWRHGSGSGERQSALHGVMIERLSGQLVMFAVAMCGGLWLMAGHPDLRMLADSWTNGVIVAVLGAVAVVAFILGLGSRAWQGLRRYLATLGRDIYRGLLNRESLPLQIASSLLVVGSYLGVFWLLAASGREAMGPEQTLTLLALCSLLLLAMVIPLTVAGWGVREGAAAVLWPLAGLPAEQGVALSVGYGLTVLLSSLPGGLFVFSRASAGR